jgi:hypothetical protein
MSLLHVTNGRAIIPLIQQAGIAGRIVPWDDVLHEGPVPAGLNAAALRQVRAEFIAAGEGPFDEVLRSFTERDTALEEVASIDEIVLWFEHDLYDQLQLIPVLDLLSTRERPLVTAVPGDDYLGLQPAPRFAELFAARRAITSSQRVAARDAWDAFRAQDPRRILEVLERVTVLPHLAPALRRHLQQFPSIENGLSRTEQQALEALARGVTRMKDLYKASNHEREEAVFMGDLAFMFHLRALMQSPRPLIAGKMAWESETSITDDGRRVLEGKADRVALCGIDRWLGGVHVTGHGPTWRWDSTRQTIRWA